MKTLKCDLCETTAQGATFEDWMQNMMPHYKEAHADMMQKMSEKSTEEQQEEKKKWMDQMESKFNAA